MSSKERQSPETLVHSWISEGLDSHQAEIETGWFRPDRQAQDSGCRVHSLALQAGLVESGQSGQSWIFQTQTQLPSVQELQSDQVHSFI